MENTENMEKKKARLEEVIVKIKALPEEELDYAIGVITGMSAFYDRIYSKNGPTEPAV